MIKILAALISLATAHQLPFLVPNTCVSFTISQDTGCQWMCDYCANVLDTSDYYFTDGVCSYEEGGCAGNPQVDVTYKCCSLNTAF